MQFACLYVLNIAIDTIVLTYFYLPSNIFLFSKNESFLFFFAEKYCSQRSKTGEYGPQPKVHTCMHNTHIHILCKYIYSSPMSFLDIYLLLPYN